MVEALGGMRRQPSLIVKTHAFGDALLATPAAARLAAGGGEWWALAGSSSRDVWERLPGIGRVLTAPFPPGRTPAGWASLLVWSLGAMRILRGVGLTVVFHSSPGVRRWVRALTGAPSRSGGASALGRWEHCEPFVGDEHAGVLYAAIAGVSTDDYRPLFAVRPAEAAWAAGELRGGCWIAVAPGGASNPRDEVPAKRWPVERFGELCREILASGRGVALLGDGRDARNASGMVSSLGGASERLRNFMGRLDWGRTAAVISRCDAFVGIDSGPAHLASACGVPSVVLFGPTRPGSLYSEGEVVPVLSEAPCAPCFANSVFPGCRSGSPRCMDRIGACEVWKSLERILE